MGSMGALYPALSVVGLDLSPRRSASFAHRYKGQVVGCLWFIVVKTENLDAHQRNETGGVLCSNLYIWALN